ncbi:MAG: DUF3566 domain-containing protein [Candidatus Aenigmatarchaeota archaeon]
MKKIKRIGILSLATTQAIFLGIFGLILSIIYFLARIFFPETSDLYPNNSILILLPVMYVFLGFVMGAFWAFLYNLVAKLTGGIEVEIEK